MPRPHRRDAYHHGDLRTALVQAAVALLDTTDPAELSLRAVARKAGVTPAAPFHHFPAKADLLVAVALEGFVALQAELGRIDARPGTAVARLERRVAGYLKFALAHRAHYRVMFHPHLADSRDAASYAAAAREAFDGLVRAVSSVRPSLGAEGARGVAFSAWAATHGFVDLLAMKTAAALGDGTSEKHLIERAARHVTALVTAADPDEAKAS